MDSIGALGRSLAASLLLDQGMKYCLDYPLTHVARDGYT